MKSKIIKTNQRALNDKSANFGVTDEYEPDEAPIQEKDIKKHRVSVDLESRMLVRLREDVVPYKWQADFTLPDSPEKTKK